MPKVITDKKKIEQVLTRGVENIYPNKSDLEKVLLSGKRIKLYCGFDPSAPTLHIGNAILISKLAQFQELGHEVIFLIGDFTGMIGDPTDKTAARQKMTRKQVLKNSKNYKKQASALLKFSGSNPAKVLYNSEWSDKLSFMDLIELASNFTEQQMIQRGMFQERLKEDKPIYLHEFLYPLAQGYDSVAMNVDLEIGGNDQMFNMLTGRDLMKAVKNKEKFVLTMKLLVDPQGQKMGKSEGNMITLEDSAEDIYGKAMSYPDSIIIIGLELLTNISMEVIRSIAKSLEKGENPMQYKKVMAFEIVKAIKGKEDAQKAQKHFESTVQQKKLPSEIKEKRIGVIKDERLVGVLVNTDLANSFSEARRLIQQRGIKVDGKVVTDINAKIKATKEGVLIQKGKRRFVIVKV